MLAGKVEDSVMGVEHALLQKHEGVTDSRPGLIRKSLGQGLHRDLGRHLAVVVTAHAVGDDHQQGFTRITVGHPVFVVCTFAGAGFLVDGEFHASLLLLNLPTTCCSKVTFSCVGVDGGGGGGATTSSVSAFCSAKTLCGR